MQVIGLCRFSYPAWSGFQVNHQSIAEREAYLYAPERLDERFRFFETLTLPSIKAQTDGDFTFVILIGETLPTPYRERLDALVEGIPQVVMQARGSGKHRKMMQLTINSVRTESCAPCLQFRLDDDDAVAVDFVERLRATMRETQSLMQVGGYMAVDFNRGYFVTPRADGLHAEPVTKSLATAALAVAVGPQHDRTVMNFGHHKLAKEMPTVSLTDSDMFLRGFNNSNDSRQKPGQPVYDMKLLTPDEEAHIKSRFGVDSDHVREVFSQPMG